MRVAIFIDSLAVGGAQKHVRQLACEMTIAGHSVHVIGLNDAADALYLIPLQQSGVRVTVLGIKRVCSGLGFLSVASALRRWRADAVVTVLFVSTVFGRMVAQLAGVPVVLTCVQARNIDYAPWQLAMVRASARLSDFTVANSYSALRWALEKEGAVGGRSRYVPNGLDPSPKSEERSWADLGLPMLDGKKVVGSLGRLNTQKGYDVLLSAVALIDKRHLADVVFVVFGEGPARDDLEKQRTKLGLGGVVFFPGSRADAVRLLSKMCLYVQPSRFEGTPNAVFEALAVGLHVVSSAVDGVVELLSGSPQVSLVEPESALALALTLDARLTRDQEAREHHQPNVLPTAQMVVTQQYVPLLHALSRSNDGVAI